MEKRYMYIALACNQKRLQDEVGDVKKLLENLWFPYTRRLAGGRGNFALADYREWLGQADTQAFVAALTRLA